MATDGNQVINELHKSLGSMLFLDFHVGKREGKDECKIQVIKLGEHASRRLYVRQIHNFAENYSRFSDTLNVEFQWFAGSRRSIFIASRRC